MQDAGVPRLPLGLASTTALVSPRPVAPPAGDAVHATSSCRSTLTSLSGDRAAGEMQMPVPPLPVAGAAQLPPHKRRRAATACSEHERGRSLRRKASIVSSLAARKVALSPMGVAMPLSGRQTTMQALPMVATRDTAAMAPQMHRTGTLSWSSRSRTIASRTELGLATGILVRSATFLSPPRRKLTLGTVASSAGAPFSPIAPVAIAGTEHSRHAFGMKPVATTTEQLPLAPVFEQRSCWDQIACSDTACTYFACCDIGCVRLILWCMAGLAMLVAHGLLLLVPRALHDIPGTRDSACFATLRDWWTVLAALGMTAVCVSMTAATVYALGSARCIPLAVLLLVIYCAWAWIGVAWMAPVVSAVPSSGCTTDSAAVTFASAAALGTIMLLSLIGAYIWHRLTRRIDSDSSCKGCCYLGACIRPFTYVESTRVVTACFCFSCQIASNLPPPPAPDHAARLSRSQFVHAETCLPCADQVTDPDKMVLRTYGGQGGIRALRQHEQRQLRLINRARDAAGLSPRSLAMSGAGQTATAVNASTTRPKLQHPARAMRALATPLPTQETHQPPSAD